MYFKVGNACHKYKLVNLSLFLIHKYYHNSINVVLYQMTLTVENYTNKNNIN